MTSEARGRDDRHGHDGGRGNATDDREQRSDGLDAERGADSSPSGRATDRADTGTSVQGWGRTPAAMHPRETVGQGKSWSADAPTSGAPATPPGEGAGADDLGPSGAALLAAIRAKYDLRPDEAALALEMARTVDALDWLAKAIREAGSVVVAGSKGQVAAHPLLAEARQHRLTLARLSSTLGLPDDEEVIGATPASRKAVRAANSRWLAEGPGLIEGAHLGDD